MKRRWLIYIIIGVFFGVFDFFYQNFIQKELNSSLFRLILILGIWLVPAIPVVLHEVKISHSKRLSSISNVLLWCASIFSYYMFYAIKLAFFSLETRPELHISNYQKSYFGYNWKSVFWHDIFLRGIIEWSLVAVIGGFIVGFIISSIYLYLQKRSTAN